MINPKDTTYQKMSKRSKKPAEAAQGRYFALPHAVLDSDAWKRTSPPARALLMELCRQHTGQNNGHLHLARAWIESRGWNRPATVRKFVDELLQNQLIIQTRHGGLRNGSHEYCLTWLTISDYSGLTITAKDYHPGLYLLPPLPEQPRRNAKKKIGRTPHVLGKQLLRTPHVLEGESPRTPHVPKKRVSATSPRTPHVHHEYIPIQEDGNSATQSTENTHAPLADAIGTRDPHRFHKTVTDAPRWTVCSKRNARTYWGERYIRIFN